MYLKKLKLLNFKNYVDCDFDFSKKINCFTGLNGAGKTNILDAIYYLSFTKSFFYSSDSRNIRYSNDFFVIHGEFNRSDKQEKINCSFNRKKKKKFKRNGKSYERFSEHIGLLPTVMISPIDNRLITGGSEDRRKYINSVISQYDSNYLKLLIRYNRIIGQRNKLLKDFVKRNYFDNDNLDVYDEMLINYGTVIHKKRLDFINKLLPIFSEFYQFISQNKETVKLEYHSQLNEKELHIILKQNREKDRVLQYTSGGIHRDDIKMKINGYSLKNSGSQGQQKTFLISLKFAQFEFIKAVSKLKPILLLDDIFDKFDMERVGQIIKLTVDNKFGQIFITDTNKIRIKNILNKANIDFKLFEI